MASQFVVGQQVNYYPAAPVPAKVIAVHFDDGEPYYTIVTAVPKGASSKEVQTSASRLVAAPDTAERASVAKSSTSKKL